MTLDCVLLEDSNQAFVAGCHPFNAPNDERLCELQH
jgi:hypothetical protein